MSRKTQLKHPVVGFTSGVFDLLHRGHLQYLSACKTHCDYLIVAVDGDALVKDKKGVDRPYDPIERRLANVSGVAAVDEALVKYASASNLLKELRAHVYFVPDNRELEQARLDLLRALSMRLVVLPYTHGVSTSAVAQKIAAGDV
jgi:D-beta-D-heptose 7-phosphate kinase/D-beta-D-heptose 1-phosphate adenosyltransferase